MRFFVLLAVLFALICPAPAPAANDIIPPTPAASTSRAGKVRLCSDAEILAGSASCVPNAAQVLGDYVPFSGSTKDLDLGSHALKAGTAYSRMPVITSAGNVTLTADQQKSVFVEITAAGTVSLLAGIAGDTVVVYSTGAFAVSVKPYGSQVITLNGTDLTGGNRITNTSTAGDTVTLLFDGVKWRVLGTSTFTDGGA